MDCSLGCGPFLLLASTVASILPSLPHTQDAGQGPELDGSHSNVSVPFFEKFYCPCHVFHVPFYDLYRGDRRDDLNAQRGGHDGRGYNRKSTIRPGSK